MATKSPCYMDGADCPRRTVEPNCHGYCEAYIIWAEMERERRKKYKKCETEADTFLHEQPVRIRATSRERSRERNKRR